ncbi:MAG: hypothetical protein E6I68_04820 [Chloroflexi bacterium]|nr:MAG: hypothetical protein E6I68_04820 [Chloroflexota bacterium]
MPTELSRRELSWVIGGPQGGGINASAEIYAKALMRGGLHVFANIEFHSNIMGKHSYYRVTAAPVPVRSHIDEIHMLVALDQETLFGDAQERKHYPSHTGHVHRVSPGGGIVYDADLKIDPAQFQRNDVHLYPIPFFEVLEEALKQVGKGGQSRKYIVMRNTVALGASIGLAGYDEELVFDAIRHEFKGRKAEAAEMNVQAVKAAADYARSHFSARPARQLSALPAEQRQKRILIKGVQAVGIAKLKAGLGLQTYYPISPATDESVYLEAKGPQYQLTVVQAEDEISSINMAIGAAHMGIRAATSTAGPGFALMSEGFGFAAITEAPGPVVFLWQRGGPSTGLPTRTEQADLQFALHPAHGDFPHIVIASGDIEEAFVDSFESFNWADRYQVPVIVLLEKFLASSLFTSDRLDTSKLKIDRGLVYQPVSPEKNGYRRHAITPDGISPRALPGTAGGIFSTTSDEHDPEGHITEGIENRITMMRKRMVNSRWNDRARAGRLLGEFSPGAPDAAVPGPGSRSRAPGGQARRADRSELFRAAGRAHPGADRHRARSTGPEIRRPAVLAERDRGGSPRGVVRTDEGGHGFACLRRSPRPRSSASRSTRPRCTSTGVPVVATSES